MGPHGSSANSHSQPKVEGAVSVGKRAFILFCFLDKTQSHSVVFCIALETPSTDLLNLRENDEDKTFYSTVKKVRIVDALISLPRVYCAVVLLALLSACVSAEQATAPRIDTVSKSVTAAKVAPDPRPIGVPDNVTPWERGREIVRVAIELVKHGNLRDTEFASRLLRLPIQSDNEAGWSDSSKFPQQLASAFYYDVRPHMHDHSVTFETMPEQTCILQDDLLIAFAAEFGVNPGYIPDQLFLRPGVPLVKSFRAGWIRSAGGLHAPYSSLRIYRNLPNAIRVEATGFTEKSCFDISIVQHRDM